MQATVPEIPDRRRIAELIDREQRRLDDRLSTSGRTFTRAKQVLSGGVTTSAQLREPHPIYVRRGAGAKVWDVDGNEYWDFHNAFGSMVQGHAHPAISRAVAARADEGAHFGAPTEECIAVAEELARRFGLPQWRFTSSGSDAAMDAVRVARAVTGRETVVKTFGSYHGHHDAMLVSVPVEYTDIGAADDLASIPFGKGIPKGVVDLTVTVPFNDVEATARRLDRLSREGRSPACLILEPVMLNIGIAPPEPGYLEAMRELTARHGIMLVFDEVKTGLTIAAGGATETYGVTPDIVVLGKSLGGGTPAGALGGTEEVFSEIARADAWQLGTYNGNALSMAAAQANLLEVLTPEAYVHLNALNDRLVTGCQQVLEEHRLPGYAIGLGAKACVTFARAPVTDYTSFIEAQDTELSRLLWLFGMNRGIFAPPDRDEQWTLSVSHDDEAIDATVAVLQELAEAVMR